MKFLDIFWFPKARSQQALASPLTGRVCTPWPTSQKLWHGNRHVQDVELHAEWEAVVLFDHPAPKFLPGSDFPKEALKQIVRSSQIISYRLWELLEVLSLPLFMCCF